MQTLSPIIVYIQWRNTWGGARRYAPIGCMIYSRTSIFRSNGGEGVLRINENHS